MGLLVVIALIIEKTTIFGRRTYLIGANPVAARLSGVKVGQHLTFLYLTSAFLAGITGLLLASEFKAGVSNWATGYEFDALVITLLGGTIISGGFGSWNSSRSAYPGCGNFFSHRTFTFPGLAIFLKGCSYVSCHLGAAFCFG